MEQMDRIRRGMEDGNTRLAGHGADMNLAGFEEYLLVARPSLDVQDRVLEERRYLAHHYDMREPQLPYSYIMIAGFSAKEFMEDIMIRWIQRICSRQPGFVVTLNNYSGFPPGTIYLRVQDPAPFRQMTRELVVVDEYVQSNNCPPATLVARPRLPVASRLQPPVYEKAMLEYSQRFFNASFPVAELALLQVTGNSSVKLVNIFPLQPLNSRFNNK